MSQRFNKVGGVMRGCGHSIGKTPTCHEAISRVEREFTLFLGRRFRTTKDPDD
jgi:hypothetical protein